MKPSQNELVVILHGIGMPKLRMAYLEFRLKRAGFKTLNLSYPSLRRDIEGCAACVADMIAGTMPAHIEKIHFVTHSMGSLIALHLLSTNQLKNAGRAVLIAPPYHGSEVADFLRNISLYKRLFGPAGQQLTTAYRQTVDYKIPEEMDVGVIAGTRAFEYPLFLGIMKQTRVHDGLVSLDATRIPGTKDHITIRSSHSFLIEISAKEVVHFLTQGRFTGKAARIPQEL